MSENSILKRYVTREDQPANSGDAEGTEDCGAFGWLRGIRDRAVMLELRRKDGNILAVGYGYLDHVEYDPSEGITLSVAGRKIQIKGQRLNAEARPSVRLFEGITRHRVPWIQEAEGAFGTDHGDSATIVESIRW